MDKKKLPALAAGAALAALLGMNWDLFGQMNRLYGEIHALQEDFNHLREDYREAMDRQEAALQEALEREASLFSQTETTLRYEDGALVLEAGVMPKEFRAGETALLSLDTGESVPLTDDGSGWLRGRLTCSLREEVAPVAALGTAESIRREALPSLRTEEALSMECKVQWEPLGAGGGWTRFSRSSWTQEVFSPTSWRKRCGWRCGTPFWTQRTPVPLPDRFRLSKMRKVCGTPTWGLILWRERITTTTAT